MNHDYDFLITQPTLLGLLMAASDRTTIPLSTGLIEASFDRLERRLGQDSRLAKPLRSWPKHVITIRRWTGLPEALRSLIKAGHLMVTMANGRAYLQAEAAWLEGHRSMLTRLPKCDRRELAAAAHGLIARSRTSSKSEATSEETGC